MYKMPSVAYTFLMNKMKLFTIAGILFVAITGSLAHFLYDWTGKNYIIGLFAPVNESIWEHMKLLFFPMLIYALLMITVFRKNYPGIAASLCLGILTGTLFIPFFYYAYTYVLGKDFFILDIAAFILSILTAFLISYRLASSPVLKQYTLILTGLVLLLFICFVVFTYHPPAGRLFEDPASVPQHNFHSSSIS